MRALRIPHFSFVVQTAFAAASSSRMWCSTEQRPVDNEGAVDDKKAVPEEPVSAQSIERLEKELEESKASLEELKKELAYRTSDAESARRIGREDVEKAKQFGITSFGKDMLEVADTLDKGVEAFEKLSADDLAADKSLNSIFTGVKLALKILHKNMSSHGIEKMGVKPGMDFDFNQHEALARMPASEKYPADKVCHVLKDGYTIKSRILRAAQVAVSYDDNQKFE